MKAIVYTQNGSREALEVREVARPDPREGEVLVRVLAASVNTLDLLKKTNRVPGADIAGRVEAVGAASTQFQPGDEVFGVPAGFVGGFAEFVCVPEGRLAPKPANLSFEAAASVPLSSMTALQGLRANGKIRSGHKVLVNGASGGVGTFAVEIAKSFGAEVTAVCSARNLAMARAIGADHVIDYAREDFTRSGRRYDLILGVNGYHPILDYRRALARAWESRHHSRSRPQRLTRPRSETNRRRLVKAVVYTRKALELQDVPRPTPQGREVLIRIHATTAAPVDGGARSFIPGQDLAGEVEAVGRTVTRLKVGDPVVAWSGIRMGTYAEYICLSERGVLFPKPAILTYEEAATLPVSGLDATYLLRRAKVQPGERVLVNGAGGNMGTYAVQLAKVLGGEVTAVDHTTKLAMLPSIGADHVLDYTRDDFLGDGETYDVIFDVVGNRSLADILKRLRPGGRYATAVPQISKILRCQWAAWRSGKKIILWVPRTVGRHTQDFAFLKGLIEAGSVKAIVDRSFPLLQAAEAHQYVAQGRKKGHVVITVT